MTAFISISVCSEAVLFFRCNPFYIKWWETSESLGRERWSHWCQTNTFHSIYFCHIRKNVLFWKMSEWIASRRFCSPYVKLSPVKLSKGLVAMEIVPKWPRNTGTWLHEIESHYLNFHQYCVRDSLFIPLVRLCLKLSLRCLDTSSENYADIPPVALRGAWFLFWVLYGAQGWSQRYPITPFSAVWTPVLPQGCYARATHRCIQGTLLTFLSI